MSLNPFLVYLFRVFKNMAEEDRMRSEIARMQTRGDELTDQVIEIR